MLSADLMRLDLWLLKVANADYAIPALDSFWRAFTQLHKLPGVLTVVLPLLLVWLLYIYGLQAWKVLVVTGVTVGLTDSLCYRVIKQLLPRARPFENPETMSWLRHVGEAHGSSFPSNHTANVFAAAMVLAWYFPRGRQIFYSFAILIGYSRLVLGVHYPSDVLGGTAVGIFVAFLVRSLVLNRYYVFSMRSRAEIQTTRSAILSAVSRRQPER